MYSYFFSFCYSYFFKENVQDYLLRLRGQDIKAKAKANQTVVSEEFLLDLGMFLWDDS